MSTPTRHVYLSCADTAKLVRAALKQAFPGVKFSVRSSVYAGGASIDVRWTTPEPSAADVVAVTRQYEGADFDALQDLKTYRQHTGKDGSTIHYGADFIFTHHRRAQGGRLP